MQQGGGVQQGGVQQAVQQQGGTVQQDSARQKWTNLGHFSEPPADIVREASQETNLSPKVTNFFHFSGPPTICFVLILTDNNYNTTRSLGAPPGPDFLVAALRVGFGPFGSA